MLAVIKTGGKQYKVKVGDIVKIEKIKGKKEGDSIEFDQILMVSQEKARALKLGNPLIKEAKVLAKILEQGRGRKVRIEKYKPKTRYHKVRGHRQEYMKVKIEKIFVE